MKLFNKIFLASLAMVLVYRSSFAILDSPEEQLKKYREKQQSAWKARREQAKPQATTESLDRPDYMTNYMDDHIIQNIVSTLTRNASYDAINKSIKDMWQLRSTNKRFRNLISTDFIATILKGNKVDVDIMGPNGFNLLHTAMFSGKTILAEILLKSGANPRIPCYDGRNALHMAAYYTKESEQQKNLATIQLLIDADKRLAIEETSSSTSTTKSAESLVNLATLSSENTPLHYAVKNNLIDVIKLLVANGAKNTANKQHESPLSMAIKDKNEQTVVELLKIPDDKIVSTYNPMSEQEEQKHIMFRNEFHLAAKTEYYNKNIFIKMLEKFIPIKPSLFFSIGPNTSCDIGILEVILIYDNDDALRSLIEYLDRTNQSIFDAIGRSQHFFIRQTSEQAALEYLRNKVLTGDSTWHVNGKCQPILTKYLKDKKIL